MERIYHRTNYIKIIPTIVKYAFSVLLTIYTYRTMGSKGYVVIGLLEIAAIALLSNEIAKRNTIVANIVNDIVMLIYNIECLSLSFAGTFVTLVMVTNIDSLEALRGKFAIYLTGAILVVVCSLLPIHWVRFRKVGGFSLLSFVLIIELVLTMFFGNAYSPLFGTVSLVQQYQYAKQLGAGSDVDGENLTKYFYRYDRDAREKPADLPEKPNVILIMTEGLSQSIVEDERSIMPNVAEYQAKSLSFSNYFNHTFATYRGISGQLYSGYQYDNYDTNTLVSIPDALREKGYQSAFINTEPLNVHFTNYLENLGFDTVISEIDAVSNEDSLQYITDEASYDLLFDTAIEMGKGNDPFFLSIYTFETHVSMVTNGEKYGDGSDDYLNKFYNTDAQFGAFMERLEESDLADNTIVVFTADHCTYGDDDFRNTFPNYERASNNLDRIPFFVYYSGVAPEVIDVSGRNSLDLAPTLMDYLDLEGETYFLGSTLFYNQDLTNNYDTVFYDTTYLLSSNGGVIHELSESEKKAVEQGLMNYFTAKQQTPQK